MQEQCVFHRSVLMAAQMWIHLFRCLGLRVGVCNVKTHGAKAGQFKRQRRSDEADD